MNHPSQEEWVAHVYGELPPARQETLEAHLGACPECRAQVEQWRATMAALTAWQVPAKRQSSRQWQAQLKWALAALVVLALGVGWGRLSGPKAPDTARLSAELLPTLQAELRKDLAAQLQAAIKADRSEPINSLRLELGQDLDQRSTRTLAAAHAETRRLLGEVIQTWAAAREQDQQATLALYDRAEQQRKADLAWLRRDLETVAVFTDARLQSAQQEIGQLADYTLASAEPSSTGSTPLTTPTNERK
jgi:anti-sigma factor RsiW